MNTCIAYLFTFPAATINHPRCRNLDPIFSHIIMRYLRIFSLQCFELQTRYNRIHKKTSGIALHLRVRQLCFTYLNYCITHIVQCYLASAFLQFTSHITIFEIKKRMFSKTVSHMSNDIFSFQFFFEYTLTIGIVTLIISKHTFLPRRDFQCFYRNNQIFDLCTVCTNILHSRSTHFSRYQR